MKGCSILKGYISTNSPCDSVSQGEGVKMINRIGPVTLSHLCAPKHKPDTKDRDEFGLDTQIRGNTGEQYGTGSGAD